MPWPGCQFCKFAYQHVRNFTQFREGTHPTRKGIGGIHKATALLFLRSIKLTGCFQAWIETLVSGMIRTKMNNNETNSLSNVELSALLSTAPTMDEGIQSHLIVELYVTFRPIFLFGDKLLPHLAFFGVLSVAGILGLCSTRETFLNQALPNL